MSVIQRSIIIALLGVCSMPVHAQFTYVSADFEHSRMAIEGVGRNFIRRSVVNLTAVHRPFRNIGFGATLPISIYTKVAYTMKGGEDWERLYGRDKLYKPQILNSMDVRQEFCGFIRIYLEPQSEFFVDLRCSSYFFEQSINIERNAYGPENRSDGQLRYAAIPARSESFLKGIREITPGFSVGFAPHVSKHAFVLLAFDMDFLDLSELAYSVTIESAAVYEQNRHQYSTLRNSLARPVSIWSLHFGGGLFF